MQRPDIEIARDSEIRPIKEVADKLGVPDEYLFQYGPYKAKIDLDYIQGLNRRPRGKLILVTALTPTPAGEGKTTTTVGLGDGLNRIGKNAAICIREPSLGPCFGIKGGAAGGGGGDLRGRLLSLQLFKPKPHTQNVSQLGGV